MMCIVPMQPKRIRSKSLGSAFEAETPEDPGLDYAARRGRRPSPKTPEEMPAAKRTKTLSDSEIYGERSQATPDPAMQQLPSHSLHPSIPFPVQPVQNPSALFAMQRLAMSSRNPFLSSILTSPLGWPRGIGIPVPLATSPLWPSLPKSTSLSTQLQSTSVLPFLSPMATRTFPSLWNPVLQPVSAARPPLTPIQVAPSTAKQSFTSPSSLSLSQPTSVIVGERSDPHIEATLAPLSTSSASSITSISQKRQSISRANISSTLDFISPPPQPVFDATMGLSELLVNVMALYKKKVKNDMDQLRQSLNKSNSSQEEVQKKTTTPELWSFFLELLTNESQYDMIRWVNKEVAEFAILDTDEVAHLWGRSKNKPKMNYDTMSRGIRYYYNQGIITKGNNMMFKYNYCYTEVALAKLCENTGWKYIEQNARNPHHIKFIQILHTFHNKVKQNGFRKQDLEEIRGTWHSAYLKDRSVLQESSS